MCIICTHTHAWYSHIHTYTYVKRVVTSRRDPAGCLPPFGRNIQRWLNSRKRLFKELDNLECEEKPTKAVKIHKVLTSLSPMKANKYFDGRISDNTKSMSLVGFDTLQQRELATQHD